MARSFVQDTYDRDMNVSESYRSVAGTVTDSRAGTVYLDNGTNDLVITIAATPPADVIQVSGLSDGATADLSIEYGDYIPVRGITISKKLTGTAPTVNAGGTGLSVTAASGAFNTELKKGGADWVGAEIWGYKATNTVPWMIVGYVVSVTDNDTLVIDDGAGAAAPGAGLSFTTFYVTLTGTSHMEWGHIIGTGTEYDTELPGVNELIYTVYPEGSTAPVHLGTITALASAILGHYTEHDQWTSRGTLIAYRVATSAFMFDPNLERAQSDIRVRLTTNGAAATASLNTTWHHCTRFGSTNLPKH